MAFLVIRKLVLLLALGPLVYYALTVIVSLRFFRKLHKKPASFPGHFPAVSILKPVRGVDRDAYENFASFCNQDYSEYEVLFCVSDADDPVIPLIEKLKSDLPGRQIRLLVGSSEAGANRKVNKLCRLTREAKYELLVISDSDVRVSPDYLRGIAECFVDENVGAATVFFRSMTAGSSGAALDAAGSAVEFASCTVLAEALEGIHFTLGATMATTKKHLREIGGFEALVDHNADDYELGSRIAASGYQVALAREPVWMVYPRETVGQFLRHELRWTVGLRNARPGGHAALVFTFGLPWTLLAAAAAPSAAIMFAYVIAYLLLRYAVYLTVGVWGLRDPVVTRLWWLAPVRDLANFSVWVASFFSNKIEWRGIRYQVHKGLLLPLNEEQEQGGFVTLQIKTNPAIGIMETGNK